MRLLIRGIAGLCAVIGFYTGTSQAVLLKDMGLILDTTTGVRWVPVSHGPPGPATGALAIEDLEPGQRYATHNEVSTLLETYIFPLSCDFSGASFGCTPSAYQALTDFIHIFRAEEDLVLSTLRGVFDPQGPKDTGIAMFLTLIATEERGAFFDMQSIHYPPIPGDGSFGMFLVSTVPEPSTILLFGSVAYPSGERVSATCKVVCVAVSPVLKAGMKPTVSPVVSY